MFEILGLEDIKSDRILTLPNTTWEDFEQLACEENSGYKISYLNNELTIVSPSRNHERVVQTITILINAYCRKHQIPYFALGSRDIKEQFSTFTYSKIYDYENFIYNSFSTYVIFYFLSRRKVNR